MRAASTAVCLLMLVSSIAAADLQITNVQAERRTFDPARGEQLTVRFRLSLAAAVTMTLYDGRDVRVQTVDSAGVLPAGDNSLRWDGTDLRGRPVLPEAYVYTLVARAKSGADAVHDLTDVTGGQTLVARDVRWDPSRGLLSYVLEAPARVNVRVGLRNNGPLLRTIVDWVPQAGGLRQVPWDGRDASGVLSLAEHPGIVFGVQAFALPDNAILVGPPVKTVAVIEDLPRNLRRHVIPPPAKRMYAHAQQTLEGRGDFAVTLALPEALPLSKAGLPIVTGPVPVRLDVPPGDLDRALARRFEPVFFIDGQFAFENEIGFAPMTWTWDPEGVNPGEHFLTVNLRGYEGNFGIASIKVLVRAPTPSAYR